MTFRGVSFLPPRSVGRAATGGLITSTRQVFTPGGGAANNRSADGGR